MVGAWLGNEGSNQTWNGLHSTSTCYEMGQVILDMIVGVDRFATCAETK